MSEGSEFDAEIKIISPEPSTQRDVDRVRSVLSNDIEPARKARLEGLAEATLSTEQLDPLRAAEQAAKEFYVAKLAGYGVDTSAIDQIPPIFYTSTEIIDKDTKHSILGTHFRGSGTTIVHIAPKTDMYHAVYTIGHELSHATTRGEVRLYFGGTGIESVNTMDGLKISANRQATASGIEEGMVILDQLEFGNRYLKATRPSIFQKKLASAKSPPIQHKLPQLKDYGDVKDEELAAFLATSNPPIPIIGSKFHYEQLQVSALKHYLFIKRLCEMIGHAQSPNAGNEDAFKIGRNILDLDRYKRTGDAHRKIVSLVGGLSAKSLFQLADHPGDAELDHAMNILNRANVGVLGIEPSVSASRTQRDTDSLHPV